MSQTLHKVNTLARGEIAVYDSSGNAISGLVNGNFANLLSKDGVNSAVAVSVAEVGGGRYTVTFTPTSTGIWTVLVRHATYNPRGWTETFNVTADGAFGIAEIADGVLDRANGVESGWSVRKILRVIASVLAGKTSGGPGSTVFRDVGDTKPRVTATADSSGNRTAITLDPD